MMLQKLANFSLNFLISHLLFLSTQVIVLSKKGELKSFFHRYLRAIYFICQPSLALTMKITVNVIAINVFRTFRHSASAFLKLHDLHFSND